MAFPTDQVARARLMSGAANDRAERSWPATFPLPLLLACAGCAGLPGDRMPAISVAAEVVTAAPVRRAFVPFPGGVRAYQAVTYTEIPGYRPLTLDLYLPPTGERSPRPLVVFVHGGAWRGGDPRKAGAIEDFPALLAALARRGFAVASISYRLSDEARFPAAPADVVTALRWLQANPEFRIDSSRTILWGASAGAHLATLAALTCEGAARVEPRGAESLPDPGWPRGPCVRGVVAWYGIFNLGSISRQAAQSRVVGTMAHNGPDAPEWRMLGCVPQTCAAELQMASPVNYVGPLGPPMLLIAGTQDRTVPPEQSIELAERLQANGISHRLVLIDGADHSFIGATHEDTDLATRRAVEATFAFIESVAR